MNLEYSYYTDAAHNYLAIRCPEETSGRNYQIRMLTRNRIEGLLPCMRLSVGEEEDLYYDITSRQSLKNLYENRMITGADLQHLLEEILTMEREIADYLLDCARVIRSPELVFYDMFRDRYSFLYYPASCENTSQELFSFVSEHLDETDRDAVYAACRLMECSENPNFVLTEELVRELFPARSAYTQEENTRNASEQMETESFQDEQDGAMERETDVPYIASGRIRRWDMKEETQEPETKEVHAGRSRANTLLIISAAVCLLTGGGLEWLRRNQPLRQDFLFPMLIGEMVILFAAIVLSAAAVYTGLRKPSKADEEDAAEEMKEAAENRDFSAQRQADEAGEYEPDRYYDGYVPETSWIRRKEGSGRRPAEPIRHSFLADGQVQYGTDLYEERLKPEEAPSKLHGLGSARMYHIDLSKLPVTVGRMGRFSDYTVDDTSVSGMHVRFNGTPEQITVEDLNSANGTYLNGARLKPGERQTLCRGDEVRIGRLEFCYR